MRTSRKTFLTVVGFGAFTLASRSAVEGAAFAMEKKTAPLRNYPELWQRLTEEADRRAQFFGAGSELRITPAQGVYAPDLARNTVDTTQNRELKIGPDGILTFALDVPAPMYVTGEMVLDPDSDLRPGLRATVLSDATLIAAPMLSADLWGSDKVTDAAPKVIGWKPGASVVLNTYLLPAGRHYLSVAGPHFRSGGQFRSITLRPVSRPVEEPIFTFAFISDTHVRYEGRPEWMNIKMGEASAPMFVKTLHSLAAEGVDFLMHGGDMTEGATREEFDLMAKLLRDQPLPAYGCIGNHDAYHPTSRPDALELLAKHFPGGSLDYTLDRSPVRFVVLDENIAKPEMREAKQEWLRKTLASDTRTPTVVVWHYAPFNRGGMSNCGFRLKDWSKAGKESVLDIVQSAPHVFATLNGHDHWDEVNIQKGITHIQNAAFVEWPNSYRVIRVHRDRLEWEVRQVANRGFIRESFAVPKALSWMIATREQDLTGTARFSALPEKTRRS